PLYLAQRFVVSSSPKMPSSKVRMVRGVAETASTNLGAKLSGWDESEPAVEPRTGVTESRNMRRCSDAQPVGD
ncbi:MAG TPA: hypothetical protein PLB21_13320, partial [Actinomycetota bacterium]|nr:hypothetical protein [Actinomycetota bacterium]